MAQHLMNLRYVPEDEIIEVCALLDENDIAHYMTPPSMWGVSAGGLWLQHKEDKVRAKALLAEYQKERQLRMRQQWQEQKDAGHVETLWQRVQQRPVTMVVTFLAIVLLLALSLLPFVLL